MKTKIMHLTAAFTFVVFASCKNDSQTNVADNGQKEY
jgi:hypothetical protein